MNRLLVASTYMPPRAGGAERVAWELAKRLVGKYEVHILTTEATLPAHEARMIVHRVTHFPLLTLVYSTVARLEIKRILKEVSPDIIHAHMALPWGYVLRGEGSKRVITCHGSDVFPKKRHPRTVFLVSALHNASRITAPSRWLCAYIQEKYGLVPALIPNGVDTEIFRPLENILPLENVVLFVGRFIERKGIFDILKAARVLPEYEFWMVGGPNAAGSLSSAVPPNVRTIGFVELHDQVLRYYAQASLCVFPSHWENFPVVGLEAMACGKPVVATELGFSEYIENGHDGILVKPHDSNGLANSIRYLMEDDQARRKLGENARKKALQYDWDIIAGQYETMYEQI